MQVTRIFGARQHTARPSMLETLVGVALPSPSASVDLRPWDSPIDNQIGSQCVGESIKGLLSLSNSRAGVISKRPSQHGIYTAARARERTRVGDAIVDVGCIPADAFDACVTGGVYPEDDIDRDPSKVNALETWDEALKSAVVPVDAFSPIDDGDIDTVKRWLTAGAGVFFAMQVDQSYNDLLGPGAWDGPKGTPLGGHAQAVVGYDAEAFIIRNSWGTTSWGDRGYGRITLNAFAQAASCLVAVRQGVIL